MNDASYADLRDELLEQKVILAARLERIHANVRRGFNADSKEMAKELEDTEVVDALGNEARDELARIAATLQRIEEGSYGKCIKCGDAIDAARLEAYPYADECIECARDDERRKAHI